MLPSNLIERSTILSRKAIWVTFFSLMQFSFVVGQSVESQKLLDLTGEKSRVFDLDNGLFDTCVEAAYQDPTGRLWIKACTYASNLYGLHFTIFDGYRGYEPQLFGDIFPPNIKLRVYGMTEEGILYGTFSGDNRQASGLYTINTLTHELRTCESNEIGSGAYTIQGLSYDSDSLVVLSFNLPAFEINHVALSNFASRTVVSRDSTTSRWLTKEQTLYVGVADILRWTCIKKIDQYYWISISYGGLSLYDADTDLMQIDKLLAEDVKSFRSPDPIFTEISTKNILRRDGSIVSFFTYNISRTFSEGLESSIDELSPVTHSYREIDSWMNTDPMDLPFLHTIHNGKSSISLLNEDDEWVFVELPKNIERVYQIRKSRFGNYYFLGTAKGLIVAPTASKSDIQVVSPGVPIRSVLALNDHEILFHPEWRSEDLQIADLEVVEQRNWITNDMDLGNHSKFVRSPDSRIWVAGEPFGLIWHHPSQGTSGSYATNNQFSVCTHFNDSMLVAFTLDRLVGFNYYSGKEYVLYTHGDILTDQEAIHDIDVDEESIWVATGSRLIEIDRQFSGHRVYGKSDGFHDDRFLTVTSSGNNEVWLGTFSAGVQILNTQTQQIDQMSIPEGLLNNTVVSLEPDSHDCMWAGTFKGITCIDRIEKKALRTLTTKEGIANNECNRYSSTQFPDGKIGIGSIAGLTVINPSSFQEEVDHELAPKIFATRLVWNENNAEYSVNSLIGRDMQTLELAPDKNSIKIELGLTHFLDPGAHNYSYRIGSGTWQFAGSNPTIYLNNLPAGKYDIDFKGNDHLGKESINMLSIPLKVGKFFYQQWWFYLLCSLPFILFAYLWIKRNNEIRQRLNVEVANATREIEEDKVLIEAQAQQLQELDELKSRFFANISHEFRTPLTVIKGMARSLEAKNKLELKQSENFINTQTDIILDLINQILDLVKLEAGQLELDYGQTDVMQFAAQVFDSLSPLAESKSLDFRLSCDPEKVMMDLDKDKLYRVLANLISNAVKFTGDQGSVHMSVTRESDNLIIAVKDSGIGIPEDKQLQIFNRFYQVDDSSTRESEGTGIGLNFSAELVSLMGGEISVESEENKGSIFSLSLPITNDAPVTQLAPLPTLGIKIPFQEESLTLVESDDSLPLLLIIEDNTPLRELLKSIFQTTYRIRASENGEEGIKAAIEAIPDIIISDVMMPRKSGIEVVDTLKNYTLTSHIPIILLTAKADLESRIVGLKRGADDYISKPFDEHELRLRVGNILKAKAKIRERYHEGQKVEVSQAPDLELEDRFILQIQEVLADNLDNSDFGLGDFCKAINVSRSQMHNKVKALTGQSPANYIRSLRLNEALRIIQESDLNISEVGYSVGFASHSYFSRSFAEKFGKSPSDFRLG